LFQHFGESVSIGKGANGKSKEGTVKVEYCKSKGSITFSIESGRWSGNTKVFEVEKSTQLYPTAVFASKDARVTVNFPNLIVPTPQCARLTRTDFWDVRDCLPHGVVTFRVEGQDINADCSSLPLAPPTLRRCCALAWRRLEPIRSTCPVLLWQHLRRATLPLLGGAERRGHSGGGGCFGGHASCRSVHVGRPNKALRMEAATNT